jgi:ribosomal protein S18 acetylase RimI-like enzyme
MRIAPYGKSDFIPLVEFWNKHVRPVEPALFEKRVIQNQAFDPKGLFLAKDKHIVGFAHAARLASVGHVCMLFVQPHYRGRGIGSELLENALDYLAPCSEVWVAKHFDTPFYGNREGPFPPLYGSSEFTGMGSEDIESAKFLERRGFALHHRSVEMKCVLSDVPKFDERGMERYHFFSSKNIAPWEKVRYEKEGDFYVDFAADHAGALLGAVVWYKLGDEEAGIYDVHVEKHWHDRGIGTWLLTRALQHMGRQKFRTATLVTTETNPRAVHVYERVGFKPNRFYSNYLLKREKV